MTEKSTEELLTTYLQTHDSELMGPIYERLQEPMYALALRFVRSPDEAEDIVQNVFLKLASIEPYEIKSAKSFVFRMVKTASLDHRKREKRHRRKLRSLSPRCPKVPVESDPDFEHDEDSPHDVINTKSPPPEEQLEVREAWEKVERALDRLPAKQRQAAVAFFGNGLTSEETGKLIGAKAARGYKYARQGVTNLRRILAPNRVGHGIRRDGVANAV